eukprot:609762-Hanusia_phi.AAC.1
MIGLGLSFQLVIHKEIGSLRAPRHVLKGCNRRLKRWHHKKGGNTKEILTIVPDITSTRPTGVQTLSLHSHQESPAIDGRKKMGRVKSW